MSNIAKLKKKAAEFELKRQPDKALSDGPQSIYPAQFAEMMDEIAQIAPVVHRTLPRGVHVEAVAAGAYDRLVK